MQYIVSRKFKKSFDKLPLKIKQQFLERRRLFEGEPHHPQLRNHTLTGKYTGCRSFNITGDVRTVFEQLDVNLVHLIAIGTHSQLYGK